MIQSESTTKSYSRFLLKIGEGRINPAERVVDGEITDAEIDQLLDCLESDDPYSRITEQVVPVKCVDGRSRKDGRSHLGPCTAGGTFSLVMADALTNDSYRHPGENAFNHAKRIYDELTKSGYKVGGHDDDMAGGQACGCGAEDKLDSSDPRLPSILRYITHRGVDIRNTLKTIGVNVDNKLHAKIVSKSHELSRQHYAVSGFELRQAFLDVVGNSSIETLTGPHHEVALVINNQPDTTLNRHFLKVKFGDLYQAFDVDVAALKKSCELISLSESEAHDKFMAALYYNLATAAVLAGPSLPVVVR
jgi:Cadmium carbonic anhydrase repeat